MHAKFIASSMWNFTQKFIDSMVLDCGKKRHTNPIFYCNIFRGIFFVHTRSFCLSPSHFSHCNFIYMRKCIYYIKFKDGIKFNGNIDGTTSWHVACYVAEMLWQMWTWKKPRLEKAEKIALKYLLLGLNLLARVQLFWMLLIGRM